MSKATKSKTLAKWTRAYFHWLEAQVREEGHQRRTYTDLLMLMHSKEFVWLIPNDDNRIHDGMDLRREFIHETEAPNWVKFEEPCSVLEVLVGLSRRVAFAAGGNAEGWAWQLLINLDLERMSDPLSQRKAAKVDQILEALIWRTYNPDGSGGFFPLSWPEEDQTKIELWYQMSAYVNEIHPDY
jgi:hypothetical protein